MLVKKIEIKLNKTQQNQFFVDQNNLRFIHNFYPSSKTCSSCGSLKRDLKLRDRIYKCINCGQEIDRDLNASINLSRIGGYAENSSLV